MFLFLEIVQVRYRYSASLIVTYHYLQHYSHSSLKNWRYLKLILGASSKNTNAASVSLILLSFNQDSMIFSYHMTIFSLIYLYHNLFYLATSFESFQDQIYTYILLVVSLQN